MAPKRPTAGDTAQQTPRKRGRAAALRKLDHELAKPMARFAAEANRFNQQTDAFFLRAQKETDAVKDEILRREYKRFGVKEGDGEELAFRMWLHNHPQALKRPLVEISTLPRQRGQPRKPLPRRIAVEIDRVAVELRSVNAACSHVATKYHLGSAQMVRARYRRMLGQKSR